VEYVVITAIWPYYFSLPR